MLKKDKSLRWNEECKKPFIQIQEKLSYPLILTRPKVGEILFLYITTFEKAMGIVSIIERDGKQRPIYYTNKIFHGAKMRYQKIERLAHAFILALKRLKPYF